MNKQIKKINEEIYDELMIAQLTQNKEKLAELESRYQNQLYEIIEVEIPDVIPYVDTLIEKDLIEYEDNIYAGIELGSMYSFDFNDKIVTVSIVLMDNYVFLTEYKRVFYSNNVYKKAYLYANYETGEIIKYIGPKHLKEALIKEFNYQEAIQNILKCSEADSLEALFNY